MSTIEAALKAIGGKGAKVTQVIPANASAIVGVGTSGFGSGKSHRNTAEQTVTERRPTLS